MFKHRFLLYVLILSLLIVVAQPLFSVLITRPLFHALILKEKKAEAERIVAYMNTLIKPIDITAGKWILSPSLQNEFHQLTHDFNILKYRVFAKNGEILQSTEASEVGQRNGHDYFYDRVAKGGNHTVFVAKNAFSAEGVKWDRNLIELYVPIMRNRAFVGAVEIYYDISVEREEALSLLNRATLIIFLLATALMVAVWFILNRTAKALDARVEAETKAREGEARIQAILCTALDAIVVLDHTGKISYLNLAAEKLFGTSCQDMLGESLRPRLLPQGMADSFMENLESFNAAAPSEPFNRLVEMQVVHSDGQWVDVEMAVVAVTNDDRTFFTAILRDISSRKEVEKALLVAKESAEQANEAKSKFLASMSHEIRTPLNAIIGLNEMLLQSESDQRKKRYLEVAKGAGESLRALINDILDLSKIEANQLVLENISFPLRPILDQTLAIMESKAKGKGIVLTHEFQIPPQEIVSGDPERLRQILFNLMGNAIKFTDRGSVDMKVLRDHEGMVRVEVTDTGPGISLDKQELIFHPFTQTDPSFTRRFGGAGLGLNICRRLVDLMQGRLWVESGLDQGSRFCFCVLLPQVSNQPSENISSKSMNFVHGTHTRPLKILLAEDVFENAIVVEAFLEGTQHTLLHVTNGLNACNQFKKERFDLVLMDVQMPVMDGFAATEEIRRWQREQGLSPTPIVGLTAHAMKDVSDRLKEVGCDICLTKPLRRSRLLNLIHSLAGEEKARGVVPISQEEPAVVASSQEGGPVNMEVFEHLQREMGGDMDYPLSVFRDSLQDRVHHIILAHEHGDSEALRSAAHKLKGASATFGAQGLSSLCLTLEECGRAGNLDQAQGLLPQLEEEKRRVQEFLDQRAKIVA